MRKWLPYAISLFIMFCVTYTWSEQGQQNQQQPSQRPRGLSVFSDGFFSHMRFSDEKPTGKVLDRVPSLSRDGVTYELDTRYPEYTRQEYQSWIDDCQGYKSNHKRFQRCFRDRKNQALERENAPTESRERTQNVKIPQPDFLIK